MEMNRALDDIKKLYHENDVSMFDLLATTPVSDVECDLTFEDAHLLYQQAKEWADGRDNLSGDRKIVMTCDELAHLLTAVKEYKHWYLYDSDQNRDGQGEWHADVWLGDEPLDENGWGDGEESFSFDEVK